MLFYLKDTCKILFLIIFFFSNVKFFCQNIEIASKLEKIEIKEDSSFVNEVEIKFKKASLTRFFPIFYDSELEEISNIQLFVKKGKNFKKLKILKVFDDDVKLDYIASKKIKNIKIPIDKEVLLKYNINCKELIYFSSLPFFSYNKIDSLNYKVVVPKTFGFIHKTSLKDSLNYFSIDSTKTKLKSTWNIKVVPKHIKHDPLQFFGIYKKIKVPLMRTLIVPKEYEAKPLTYMNNWYMESSSSKKGLNDSAKSKIDQLTEGIIDKEETIKVIYNYVKNNFKYVAIEVGMGAFIPSHVNYVFNNKEGDCKDLSNFLSEALKYKNINSNIALASTFEHINDCDFPSLSSANHVICIAYINKQPILLDPTDPIHLYNTPVQSLQNRTILIVNSKGGKFFKVKPFPSKENKISYDVNLKMDTKKMLLHGPFSIRYTGISDNYLQRYLDYENQEKFDNFIKQHYENIFGNQSISNIVVSTKENKFQFKGNISITGKTFNDGLKKYLFIDFLPKLIETEEREKLLAGSYLDSPFSKIVKIKVISDEPIHSFETKKHIYKEQGISLILTIKTISEKEIDLEYNFEMEHLFINAQNANSINNVLTSFKQKINEPIIFEKK